MKKDSTRPSLTAGNAGFYEKLVVSLVALENFLAEVHATSGREPIMALTMGHLRTLMPIQTAGFYFPRAGEFDFVLHTPLPPEEAAQLNALVEQAIESGVFGWALKHTRPAAFKTRDGRTTLMLAGLRTRGRLLGMFAAIVGAQSASGWDATCTVLATHLACAADAILTEELTSELQEHNRKLDALVQQRTQQLETMLAQRERFMRIAAHDLRNPLAVISGYAEVGLFSPTIEGTQAPFHAISAACRTMQAIIEDFLALRVLEQGKDGTSEMFDLGQVIAQILEQSEYSARAKGIGLSHQLPTGPLRAVGNLSHTHQILTNYVSNALKYSPPQTQTRISARLRQGYWRVEVQDQGPGITPAERKNLFVEFAKISNQPTGGENSTRLGLAIVKALAKAQQGRVGAEFPESGGSIFWLEVKESGPAAAPAG
jgi:signal transduction histidine kinase